MEKKKDRSSQSIRNLAVAKGKPEKKFRLERDSNP